MDTLALILVIIGALNWGMVGLFQFDLIASIFGGMRHLHPVPPRWHPSFRRERITAETKTGFRAG